MKQKLLSLIALAGAMFMSTSAWAVDPPEEVEPAYTTDWVAPEDGGVYFLYNVGADQYLGAGNHWGTHVVTATVSESEESSAQVYFWDAGISLGGGSNDMNVCVGVLPVQLTKTEDGTYYIQHLGSTRTDRYLTSEDAVNGVMTNSWIDGNLGRSAKFNIVAVEGGYTIQATNTVEAGTYFGAADPDEEPAEGEVIVRNVMNNLTPGQNIIWRFAPTNYVQCMSYEIRMEFYDKITEAEDEGVDTDAAETIYNNPNATVEEIRAAITALTAAINKQKFATLLSGATNEDPIDATEYVLENPNFDTGVDGWFITVTGQNCGWQQRTDTNPNTGEYIQNFIEAWIPNGNVLGDGVIAQTVYGLPDGKYVLELDATACHDPASGDGSDIEGVYVFIQSGSQEKRTPVKTIRLGVQHFTVAYVHDGSEELTFGLKVEGTNANWISADNFKIWYYGKTQKTLAQTELEQDIADANNVETDVPANANELTAFEKAIDDAQKVLDNNGDDDACGLAAENLSAAQAAFEASVKAYAKFDSYFINDNGELANIIDEIIKNDTWGDLVDQLEDLKDDLVGKFDARTLTTEEATAAEGQVHDLIFAFIQGDKIQKGDNLTFLLENPGFDNGLKGWTLGRGDAWTVFEGVDYHEVESWHQNFDLYQVIPNMPVGIYEISVQGFARIDGTELQEPTIELYAGNSTVRFPSISIIAGEGPDEYSLEKLYDAERFGDTELIMYDGTPVYVPNGMAGAVVYFATENPLTGQPFYQRTVKINLQEAGDLRIGVRSNSTTEWVLWDNIKITYAGNDISGYYSMIEDEQLKMQNAYEAEGAFITKASEDKYNDLNARCAKMEELTTGDEALALMKEIQEATAYIKGGAKKGRELEDCISLYNDLSDNVPSGDTAFPNVLSAASEKYKNPGKIESNEAVDDIIAGIKKAWPAYVLFDAGEEPTKKFDASHIIYNRDYQNYFLQEGYSAAGWTIENIGGNNYAVDFSEMECYNNDTINVYQAIEGLKPGFYEITVQGYYRAGFPGDYNDSIASVQNTYLEATTSIGTIAAPIMNAAADAQEIQIGFGSESSINITVEGEPLPFWIPNNMEAAQSYFEQGLYNNSLKVQVGEDGKMTISVKKTAHIEGDWTIFTNWGLYYLGKTGKNFEDELDAVESLVDANAKATQFFSLDGRQMSRLSRGMNIVRMSDGTYRKVMVK